MFKQIYIINL